MKPHVLPKIMHVSFAMLFLLSSACAHSSLYEETLVQPGAMKNYLQDKPEPLHHHYTKVLKQGEHNLVLNQMEAGLAAMEFGADEHAEGSFDEALLKIEMVFKENDENAEKALSVWHQEGMKDFKGEPYERAMAYYYRGLLYMKKGDLDNARAAFKSGLFQDARAVDGEYQQDFALLSFMVGWTSQILNDPLMAREYYQQTQKHNPNFSIPDPHDNVLILVETGGAPQKIGAGGNAQSLSYQQGDSLIERADIHLAGTHSALPIENIYAQASTRGDRVMDEINEEKSETKEATDDLGETAIMAGSMTSLISSFAGSQAGSFAGLATMGSGLLAKGAAAKMEAEADTRQWSNLPNLVHIHTTKLSSSNGDGEYSVNFRDSNGSVISNMQKVGKVQFVNHQHGQYGLGWIRSNPSVASGFGWVPTGPETIASK